MGEALVHVMECFVGGARRHLCDLTRGLVARGHEVHAVLALARDESARRHAEALAGHGVHVHEVAMARAPQPFGDRRAARALRDLVRGLAPRCVHTHGSKAGALGRLAARAARVPWIVHTPHGFAFEKRAEFGWLRRAVFRSVERRLGRATDALVVLSRREREVARRARIASLERVYLVPNGVPWPDAAERASRVEARRRVGIPEDALVLFHAGALMPEKGQLDLLEALARVGGPWRTWIAGSGPSADALARRIERRGLADRVSLLGWRDDVATWIDACDLAVLPSRSEAAPYFALEVLVRERPLLGTRVSGLEEWIVEGRNGWLVAPGDVPALAERLAAAAAEPERLAAMGAEARIGLGVEHRLETMIAAHERLYDRVREAAR